MDERLQWRNPLIETLLALTVLAMAAAQILTQRPRGMINVPTVSAVATVPERADIPQLTRFVQRWGFTAPKVAVRSIADRMLAVPAEPEPTLRLGYSVREFSFLGIPFYAYRDQGFVLYLERAGGFEIVPLGESGLALLERQTGTRLEQGFVFPFWKYYWGWLFFAAFAAIGLAAWRVAAKHRAALGVM